MQKSDELLATDSALATGTVLAGRSFGVLMALEKGAKALLKTSLNLVGINV